MRVQRSGRSRIRPALHSPFYRPPAARVATSKMRPHGIRPTASSEKSDDRMSRASTRSRSSPSRTGDLGGGRRSSPRQSSSDYFVPPPPRAPGVRHVLPALDPPQVRGPRIIGRLVLGRPARPRRGLALARAPGSTPPPPPSPPPPPACTSRSRPAQASLRHARRRGQPRGPRAASRRRRAPPHRLLLSSRE